MTFRADERERIIQERQARQEGWSRWSKPSRFITFIVTIVGLVVGIWFLFEEGSDSRSSKELPTLRAEEEPYKVKVDEQEILSVRHQDKLVYSRIHRGGDLPQVEHLLPEPEAPIDLVDYEPAIDVVLDEAEGQEKPQPEVIVVEAEAPLPTSEKVKAEKPQVKEVKEAQPEIDSIASLISQEGLDQKTGPCVQLGTLDSQDQAQQEWKRLQRKHKDLLGQQQPLIEQVDLGERGIWYRLRVGPYASLDKAETTSKELKTRKVGCFVVR